MNNEERRKIFKKAWEIRKEVSEELQCKVSDVSMSECLKTAWFQSKNESIKYIGTTIATAEFTSMERVNVKIKIDGVIVAKMYFHVDRNNETRLTNIANLEVYFCKEFQKVKIEVIKKYKELVALKLLENSNVYKNKDEKCDCSKCEISHVCNYRHKFQRLPRTQGGLGMCLKLDNVRMKNYIVRYFQEYQEIVEKLNKNKVEG